MPDPNKIALIIGVDVYNEEDLEDLPACKKDAKDLYKLLSKNLIIQFSVMVPLLDQSWKKNMDG
jgi:hypothetical protein